VLFTSVLDPESGFVRLVNQGEKTKKSYIEGIGVLCIEELAWCSFWVLEVLLELGRPYGSLS
jgi:hypothetical protein